MKHVTYSRARRWVPATVGALALGSVTVAVAANGEPARPTVVSAEAPAGAPTTPSLQAPPAIPVTTPAWLPDGVRSKGVIRTVTGALEESFTLPGSVNARTIPAEGVTQENFRNVHIETVLRVSVQTGQSLPMKATPEFYDIKEIEFNGHSATLVHAKNGLGNYRVTWTSGVNQYAVSCDRLNTLEGLSGLSSDDLVRVAASLGT